MGDIDREYPHKTIDNPSKSKELLADGLAKLEWEKQNRAPSLKPPKFKPGQEPTYTKEG